MNFLVLRDVEGETALGCSVETSQSRWFNGIHLQFIFCVADCRGSHLLGTAIVRVALVKGATLSRMEGAMPCHLGGPTRQSAHLPAEKTKTLAPECSAETPVPQHSADKRWEDTDPLLSISAPEAAPECSWLCLAACSADGYCCAFPREVAAPGPPKMSKLTWPFEL